MRETVCAMRFRHHAAAAAAENSVRLEVQIAYPEAAYAAMLALRDMAADGRPVARGTTISLAVPQRRGAVAEAARRLDREGVRVDDIVVHPVVDVARAIAC